MQPALKWPQQKNGGIGEQIVTKLNNQQQIAYHPIKSLKHTITYLITSHSINIWYALITIIQIQMGNNQICQNCERLTADQALQGRIVNKRQILTLSYGGKLPKTQPDTVQACVKETSQLEVTDRFQHFTGVAKVEYKAGWTYEGELINGVREGTGKMVWPTGDYYEGQFVNGRASGRGLFQTTNGIRYQGEFINDEIIRGKRISADRTEIYQGSFLNHNFDGYGTLAVESSFEYKGMFRKNMMEGSGRIRYADGSSYDGAFKANKKHGYGIYTYANGQRYEGYWKEGERVADTIGFHRQHNAIDTERNCEVVF